jgi:hypothetical protein
MTQTYAPDMPATGDELPDRRWALNASLSLSGVVILVNVAIWTWANSERRDFDAMLLKDPPLPRPDGWEYLLGYLLAMLAIGVLALALALLGARSSGERPWMATVAGALAMSVVMVPVVFLVSHAVNHWPGSG